MSDARPTRQKSDLADMLELLLDKGVVINADIAVTVGETELLGVKVRAAVASFETAAKYGMEFPEGTDMARVEQAAGVEPLDDRPGEQVELDDEQTDLNDIEIHTASADGSEGEGEDSEADDEDETDDEEAEKVAATAETEGGDGGED